MPSNSTEIVQQIRLQFESILTRVQDRSGEPPSAYVMERRLVRDLLELGRLLFECFFCSQHSAIETVESVDVGGERLPLHGKKRRSLRSVFGKITFERSYYYQAKLKHGYYLLDARLNLTLGGTSDLLREWHSTIACYTAYHKTGKTLHSILGQRHCTRAIEDDISRDRKLTEAFSEQDRVPEPSLEATILVLQSDGKGVPMTTNVNGTGVPTVASSDDKKVFDITNADGKGAPALAQKKGKERVRLGKGEKSGRKKEAIASAVYTIAPHIRTPQQVTDSLFKEPPPGHPNALPGTSPDKERKRPFDKWLWATFAGKAAATSLAKKQALQREGVHITARVALTDGAASLQNQILKQLSNFMLILDIIHAIEYLWKAANGLYGETSAKREAWVRERVLLMLSGKTQEIIDEFRKLAAEPGRKKRASTSLLNTMRYYERNLPYMRYGVYLEKGWPIGTGVIEGACRHLIKDRCELSGMRWTIPGAEALLHLRSIAENDDWEQFEAFRQEQRRREVYGNIVRLERRTTIERAAIEATAVVAETKAA